MYSTVCNLESVGKKVGKSNSVTLSCESEFCMCDVVL